MAAVRESRKTALRDGYTRQPRSSPDTADTGANSDRLIKSSGSGSGRYHIALDGSDAARPRVTARVAAAYIDIYLLKTCSID